MIQFFIDKKPHYLLSATGKVYTQEEADRMERQRIERDRKAGYDDRMAGYYDKWYRYKRSDNGKAYDEGQQAALKNPKCEGSMEIIPCMA